MIHQTHVNNETPKHYLPCVIEFYFPEESEFWVPCNSNYQSLSERTHVSGRIFWCDHREYMLQTMFIEMTKRKTSIDVGKERKHLQKRF